MKTGSRNRLVATLLGIIAAAALARYGLQLSLEVIIVLVLFFAAVAVSFVRGTDGLYIVIFAMLFSPEIGSGLTAARSAGAATTDVVIRLEDLLLVAVVLGWVFRSAYVKDKSGIIGTKVNPAIWLYMGVSVFATLLGLLRGSVKSFPAGMFHNLKYFEYFLLFFMILAHVRKIAVVARMITAMLVVFFLAMVYGYAQIGAGARVCAPFDAEPNTFGGYIVLLMCVAAGIALVDRRTRVRVMMVALLLFALPPLLFTLSRASYLALITALLSLLAISRHRVLIGAIIVALIAAVLLGLPMLPSRVQERVAGTFEQETEFHVQIGEVHFDASSSARLLSYGLAVRKWTHRPLFGYGVTGTHFIDGQYPRLLVETGVVGLAVFLFVFWRLLRLVWQAFRECTDPFLKGATMGFYCAIIAMLAHALSANSFIIVRIAEPFWMLAALVLLVPRLSKRTEDGQDDARKHDTGEHLAAGGSDMCNDE